MQNGNQRQEPRRRAALSSSRPSQQPAKLPDFVIVALMPVETGNLLAFVSVRIGRQPSAMTVHKWRLVRHGDRDILTAPQENWQDDDGQRRYKTLFEFPKSWRQPLADVVIAAWREHKQQQAQQQGGAL